MNKQQRFQIMSFPFKRSLDYVRKKLLFDSLPLKPYYSAIDISYKCNLKCIHCELWKRPANDVEMSLEQLKELLMILKGWLYLPYFNICGGEPFLHKDIMELLRFASQQGILLCITSNGTLIDEATAREIIDLDVYRIYISLDGIREETHDRTRGVQGTYKKAVNTIKMLKSFKKEARGETRICVNTILMNSNLNEIPEIVDWVVENDLDEIYIIPLDQNVGGKGYGQWFNFDDHWYEKNPLWIKDAKALDNVLKFLIRRKEGGAPVANPISHLKAMRPYYMNRESPRKCRSGITIMGVTPTGHMNFCPYEKPIGSLMERTPAELWSSAEAFKTREKTESCREKCMIPFCAFSLKEKTERYMRIFE